MCSYLCSSSADQKRNQDARRTCGWTQPWVSGRGFLSTVLLSHTSLYPADRSHASSRRWFVHSSSNLSHPWSLHSWEEKRIRIYSQLHVATAQCSLWIQTYTFQKLHQKMVLVQAWAPRPPSGKCVRFCDGFEKALWLSRQVKFFNNRTKICSIKFGIWNRTESQLCPNTQYQAISNDVYLWI